MWPTRDCAGRRKVVYTDYTNAVIYVCLSIDDEKECPRDRVHVEIVSRDQVIPEDVLSELYTYVAKACVPVSSLVDAVPGKDCRWNTGTYTQSTCAFTQRMAEEVNISAYRTSWELHFGLGLTPSSKHKILIKRKTSRLNEHTED